MDPTTEFLLQMLAVNPEWVGGAGKNAQYAPPDIGSQASQINAVQDMMQMGTDPLMGLLFGAFNEESLQPQIIEPAVEDGANRIQAIIDQSPNSVEAFIAAEIQGGNTAEGAIAAAQEMGLVKPGAKVDAEGKPIKNAQGYTEVDDSAVQTYRKFASDLWNMKLADKPAVTQEHPFIKRMLDAGFTDPRQQYTPEYINGPGLQAAQQGQQSAVDAFYRAAATAGDRDNVRGWVDRMATDPTGGPPGRGFQRGTRPIDGRGDVRSLDSIGQEGLANQTRNIAGNIGMGSYNMGDLPYAQSPRSVMAQRAPRGAPGRGRANRGEGRSNVSGAPRPVIDTRRESRARSDAFRRAESAGDRNRWEQIKTQRAARQLQQQNGTPFQAEFAQRLAAMRAMGVQ